MQHFNKKLYLTLLTAVLLTACNDSSDNSSSNDNSSNDGPLQQFTSNTGDSKEIMAPSALQQDLSSLFGAADGEPVAVNANDSVSSLIQRNN